MPGVDEELREARRAAAQRWEEQQRAAAAGAPPAAAAAAAAPAAPATVAAAAAAGDNEEALARQRQMEADEAFARSLADELGGGGGGGGVGGAGEAGPAAGARERQEAEDAAFARRLAESDWGDGGGGEAPQHLRARRVDLYGDGADAYEYDPYSPGAAAEEVLRQVALSRQQQQGGDGGGGMDVDGDAGPAAGPAAGGGAAAGPPPPQHHPPGGGGYSFGHAGGGGGGSYSYSHSYPQPSAGGSVQMEERTLPDGTRERRTVRTGPGIGREEVIETTDPRGNTTRRVSRSNVGASAAPAGVSRREEVLPDGTRVRTEERRMSDGTVTVSEERIDRHGNRSSSVRTSGGGGTSHTSSSRTSQWHSSSGGRQAGGGNRARAPAAAHHAWPGGAAAHPMMHFGGMPGFLQQMMQHSMHGYNPYHPAAHHPAAGGNVDVDNMSYEQLLELASRIGDARPRGIGDDDIRARTAEDRVRDVAELDDKECVVCSDEFKAGDPLRRLPCGHYFHPDCVDRWLRDNATCPICRNPVQ